MRRKPALEETQDDQEIVARVAARDIGRAELVASCLVTGPCGSRRPLPEVTTSFTMTRSLPAIADRLRTWGDPVVMEAARDHGKPPFCRLEPSGFAVWLVGARDLRHLPGPPRTAV
jgi:transposase